MAFVGIGQMILTHHVLNLQAQYVLILLAGRKIRPSQIDMETDTNNELQEKLEMAYQKNIVIHLVTECLISTLSGCEPLSKVIEKLVRENKYQRERNILHYREINYKVLNNNEFVKLEPAFRR